MTYLMASRTWFRNMKGEKGISLLETVVALALLGIIGVAFLGALATTSNSRLIADEHVSARILAESQMEDIKKQAISDGMATLMQDGIRKVILGQTDFIQVRKVCM